MTTENAGGPHKVVLASYTSHAAAQRAVDILAERDFPVEHVTIVGSGLRLEEKILGRWTLGKELLAGVSSGAWIGLLIGLIFWIVSPWAVGAVISAVILGAIFGAIFAAVAHAVHRQAFASASAVVADRYDVLVDAEFATEARRLLTAVPATDQPR
ncbi:MAG: general stress protein [Actinoallomurus sp.]